MEENAKKGKIKNFSFIFTVVLKMLLNIAISANIKAKMSFQNKSDSEKPFYGRDSEVRILRV